MKNITYIQLIVLFSLVNSVKAQQFPYFTHYATNKFIINPAAAGIDGYSTFSLVAREQWVGAGGTPKTHAVSFDSRILGDSYILDKLPIRKKHNKRSRSGNTGWGLYLINDANGPISKTYFNGTYSHHLDMGENQLSFGLSMLAFQNRIDGSQLMTSDYESGSNGYDPLLSSNKESFWIVDANFGLFLTGRDYYVGYSALQLLNSSVQFGVNSEAEYTLNRQHNLTAGYRFFISNRLDIEPSTLLRIQEIGKVQLDLGSKLYIDAKYWLGLNFRTGTALAMYGGLNWDKYFFSYAFEYDFNSYAQSTIGTHEISVIARFGDTARRYRWLNSY